MLKIGNENDKTKYGLLSRFTTKKKTVMQKVDKPIIVNSYMYKDPEGEGLFSLFKNLFEHNKESLAETIKEIIPEVKIEQKKEVKQEVNIDALKDSIAKPKIDVKPEIKIQSFDFEETPYPIFKIPDPPHEPVKEFFKRTISNIIDFFRDAPDDIIDIKDNIVEKIQDIPEKVKIVKTMISDTKDDFIQLKLNRAQERFSNKIDKYENMFEPDDEFPDINHFYNFMSLPLPKLIALEIELDILSSHQRNILALKERYSKRFQDIITDKEKRDLKHDNLEDIYSASILLWNPMYSNYKDFIKACKIFLDNSKKVQESVKSFNSVSKKFFKFSKNCIDEIFELQNNKWYRLSEKFPLLGAITKSIRVADQINLTRCLLNNYKNFTKEYVQNGIQPKTIKYNQQYKDIEFLSTIYKGKCDIKEKVYLDKLLEIAKNTRDERIKTYAKLFDNYGKAGCCINSISNKVRLKGGISLALKACTSYLIGM